VDVFVVQQTITAPDGENACGWADVAAVVAAMQSGNAYVNVHTDDGVDPADTGSGDFSLWRTARADQGAGALGHSAAKSERFARGVQRWSNHQIQDTLPLVRCGY
jgi:hypothetical protein